MSNIDKPIYHWQALDERNPMAYDTTGKNKVKWHFGWFRSKNASKNDQKWHNSAKIVPFLDFNGPFESPPREESNGV